MSHARDLINQSAALDRFLAEMTSQFVTPALIGTLGLIKLAWTGISNVSFRALCSVEWMTLGLHSGFSPHTNVHIGPIRKNFCLMCKNKCWAHFVNPDMQNIMTVHTIYSTLICKNFDEKAVRSGLGARFSCLCMCTYISYACTMHSPVRTCAVRWVSSVQSVLHEIQTVIIPTWIVRAHAYCRCSVYNHAQYNKGHRFCMTPM